MNFGRDQYIKMRCLSLWNFRKGLFNDPTGLCLCHSLVDMHRIKLISKFSVNSEVLFVSYVLQFTVSYCCIGRYTA